MEILYGILLAIGGIFAIAIARWWVVLFHEMGHAIPALIFGDGEVKVLVGSYVEKPGGGTLQIGRLKIRAFFNLINPRIGLCSWSGKALKTWQRAIVLLGGPLASLILMGLIFTYLLRSGAHDYALFAGSILLVLAVLDLLTNLIPIQGVPDAAGQATYSDGLQLVVLWGRSRMPESERHALHLREAGKNEEALAMLNEQLTSYPDKISLRISLAAVNYELKQYEEALGHYVWLFQNKGFSKRDYLPIADCYYHLNDYEKALQCLLPYEENYHEDASLYILRGRILLAEAEYRLATHTLETACFRSPGRGEAYGLLGLALLRDHELERAKIAMEAGLKLTPNDAEIVFYHGQLLERRGDKREALAEYQRAKELGGDFHGLDFRLDSLEVELPGANSVKAMA